MKASDKLTNGQINNDSDFSLFILSHQTTKKNARKTRQFNRSLRKHMVGAHKNYEQKTIKTEK